MQRATAMLHDTGQTSARARTTTAVLGRTELVGRIGSATAPLANRIVGAKPGSVVRWALEKTAGVSSVRLLAPFARVRFTTWFRKRPTVHIANRQGRVAVFPTCLVEYQDPAIGSDLVKVFERNGVECSVADTGCCGAPFLHNGDIERFAAIATKNVAVLAAHVRRGSDIVVPQPTCGFVVRRDYVDHVPGEDATLVAAHSHDATEYLMTLHQGQGTSLDTNFTGHVPASVTYHAPCHVTAQGAGLPSRDLISLTGARVSVVQQCSGMDGMWGLRAENVAISVPVAERLGDEITREGGEVVAGDCHLANTAIAEQTGRRPVHPLQLVARAYGIPPEEER
jgi:Fe-S oxidoreductase